MRVFLLAALLVTSVASHAQAVGTYAPGGLESPIGGLGYNAVTPTMERERQERAERGREFLINHVRSEGDLRQLAQACGRRVRQPDYCSLRGVRQLGGPSARYASDWH